MKGWTAANIAECPRCGPFAGSKCPRCGQTPVGNLAPRQAPANAQKPAIDREPVSKPRKPGMAHMLAKGEAKGEFRVSMMEHMRRKENEA